VSGAPAWFPGSAENLSRVQVLASAERALQGSIPRRHAGDRIAGDVAAALGGHDAAGFGAASPQSTPWFRP
jgi:hypothetical protein